MVVFHLEFSPLTQHSVFLNIRYDRIINNNQSAFPPLVMGLPSKLMLAVAVSDDYIVSCFMDLEAV